MRVGKNGQVEIPPDVREQAGLSEGDEVRFEFDGEAIRVRAASSRPDVAAQTAAELERSAEVEELVRRLRDSRADVSIDFDEWRALIDRGDD